MKHNALILFFKYPERGKVKTRLAAALGDDITYNLYICFLTDILKIVGNVDAEIILSSSTQFNSESELFQNTNFLSIPQNGVDLGRKMYNAFDETFRMGIEKCLLIGSDIPEITEYIISEAFLKLEEYPLTLGPSSDGGYYLIGLKPDSLYESIFEDVPWSTPGVLGTTIDKANLNNLPVHLLPELNDIDEIDDLAVYYNNNKSMINSSTINFLSSNRELMHGKI